MSAMLYLYTGTDRDKVRTALQKSIESAAKGARSVRITDAHSPDDLRAALQGGGMFAEKRVVIFENVLLHEEMGPLLLDTLPILKDSEELFYILEEKIDAATRKRLEKFAEKSERFDAAKRAEDRTVFALANALKRRDKKALWVGYLNELSKGAAPEMLHGILFWAAKDMLLKSGDAAARQRAAGLVSALAELPHEARRKGFDLEYALEHFVLSGA